MEKYGFEHLKFSNSTNKHRNALLVIACLSVLFFEYHITDEIKIYNVGIPRALIGISLYVAAAWTSFQFLFSSIDDYIDWKRNFLIDNTVRKNRNVGDRTILLEIQSFSKGQIKYNPVFGHSYGGTIPDVPDIAEVLNGLKSDMKQFEEKFQDDIASIESFKSWYKKYSWFMIFRFAFVEFAIPLIFIIYAVVISQIWPILPKL